METNSFMLMAELRSGTYESYSYNYFTLVAVCLVVLVVVVCGVVGFVMLVRRIGSRPATSESENSKRLPPSADRHHHNELVSSRCPSCGVDLRADSPMGLCPQCLLQCALSKRNSTPLPADPGATGAYRGPSTAPAVEVLAPLFPQLEILELIGQGGMGAVYKARQTKLDRLVAVKILPAEWGNDAAFAERFNREARALARLSHSQIVTIHDFGESGGLFYLVMEYVDGCNLRQLLRGGPLQPELALSIVPQICAALQYAHGEGVVHRDIKPENILLDNKGQVKIADFGLAKLTRKSAAEFTLTGSRQVMGTIDYMAPEQRTSPQDVDHRVDIYAVGVMLYEMLTGELPLGRFAPPSEKAQVDARFDAVVFRAMEKEPAQRYQRISEVQADVQAISRSTRGHHLDRAVTASEQKPVVGVGARVRSVVGGMVTLFVHRPTPINAPSAPEMAQEHATPEKGQDTPMGQAKSTDVPADRPARRPNHGRFWAGVVMYGVAGATLGLILFTIPEYICLFAFVIPMAASWLHTTICKEFFPTDPNDTADENTEASHVDGTASLAFYRGEIDDDLFFFVDKIHDVLRNADQEYLKIELRHTKQTEEATSQGPVVTATVLPFSKELEKLQERVWDQLETILSNAAQSNKLREPAADSRQPLSVRHGRSHHRDWPRGTRGLPRRRNFSLAVYQTRRSGNGPLVRGPKIAG